MIIVNSMVWALYPAGVITMFFAYRDSNTLLLAMGFLVCLFSGPRIKVRSDIDITVEEVEVGGK